MKGLMGLVAAAVLMFSSIAASAQGLEVSEAKLGKGVQNRAIADETTTFAVNEKAYLWLRVTGGPGDVKVNWSVGRSQRQRPAEDRRKPVAHLGQQDPVASRRVEGDGHRRQRQGAQGDHVPGPVRH